MEAIFYAQGTAIDHTPGADVAAGEVVEVGGLVGVSPNDIPSGKLGAIQLVGVYRVQKGATAFTAGDTVYWDSTGRAAVDTDGGGANKILGTAVLDAALGDARVYVRLIG